MASGDPSGPGGRDDWRVRVTTGVAVAACMGVAMVFGPMVGIKGFWPGMLATVVAVCVGVVLGRIVGERLFRPPGGPPDHLPHA